MLHGSTLRTDYRQNDTVVYAASTLHATRYTLHAALAVLAGCDAVHNGIHHSPQRSIFNPPQRVACAHKEPAFVTSV